MWCFELVKLDYLYWSQGHRAIKLWFRQLVIYFCFHHCHAALPQAFISPPPAEHVPSFGSTWCPSVGCTLCWVKDCVFTLCSTTASHGCVSGAVRALWAMSRTNRTWEDPFICAQGGKQGNGPGSKGKQKNPLHLHRWNVPATDKTFHVQEEECPKIPHTENWDVVSPGRAHWRHWEH